MFLKFGVVCMVLWLVCAISLIRFFVFSPGVMARRQDEITPSERRNNEKTPCEITKRRNNARRKDEITKWHKQATIGLAV